MQVLQVEIRNLNQTLSVKQTDITELNKDNARLVSELSQARKKTNEQDSLVSRLSAELEQLKHEADSLKSAVKDTALFQQQLDEANKQLHDLTITNAKLESEIQVKTDILAQLINAKRDAISKRESFLENQIES